MWCVPSHTNNLLVSEQLLSLLKYTGSGGFMCCFLGLCTWISGLGCLIQSLCIRSFFEILSASVFISYLLGAFKGGLFYLFRLLCIVALNTSVKKKKQNKNKNQN